MTTAMDIIQEAVERLGVYAPGETMTAADSARGLIELNKMMDQWSNEYLTVYQLVPTTLTCQANVGQYTIGVVGSPTINQTRPTRIQTGPGAATITVSAVATPINVVASTEWHGFESIAPGQGVPDTLFYDTSTYPAGTINVSPIPNAAVVSGSGAIVFQAWEPLLAWTSLSSPNITLAQGGDEVLKSNLALQLKPFFRDAPIDPAVAGQAMHGKFMLQQTNLVSRALIGRGPRAPGGLQRNAPS